VNARGHTGWLKRVYRGVLLCLLFGISIATADKRTLDVALISSDNLHHAEVADALREHLEQACGQSCSDPVELTTVDAADAGRFLATTRPDLVVTIGSVAAREVAQLDVDLPTLFGFIPQAVWRELTDCCVEASPTHGRVLLDQPARRLLKLVQAIHPDAKGVGVLLGPATAWRRPELEEAASAESVELHALQIESGEDIGRKLRLLTARVDALLALPDPAVYNRNTVYPILLTTYSARIPVIGYSSAMVKAGASASLFMSTRDGGEAIAAAIRDFRAHGAFTNDDTTWAYSVEINEDVLRSLRLPAIRASELPKILKESKQ
jgi:ABC-type uncharacterized transport system substrate-binding protein